MRAFDCDSGTITLQWGDGNDGGDGDNNHGIADSASDAVVIADENNHRIQVMLSHDITSNSRSHTGAAHISYPLSDVMYDI